MSVLELFCHVDDFCRTFEARWHQQCLASTTKRRNRARELALSEIMTILILFHQSHYRTFKAFYTEYVCASASRLSRSGELFPLCRVHANYAPAAVCICTRSSARGVVSRLSI